MRLQKFIRPQTTSELAIIMGTMMLISFLLWMVFKPILQPARGDAVEKEDVGK